MAIWTLPLLFAGVAFAHSGVKTVVIDGTAYAPFESNVDNYLGPVKRIEWSHDVVITAFNPIANLSDPALACRVNPRPPLLKAKARAGAEVNFKWTQIVRMHQGPIITWLGYLPTPDTKPTDVKFFKIWEQGYDGEKNKWANQIAVDNGDQYTVQLPSDIKAGTYILRTELVALHGNMANLNTGILAGPQFYPHCFNVEIIGDGTVVPEGVKIPGAYKPTDDGIKFSPYVDKVGVEGGTVEQNKKYVPPGPPKYAGKYEKPTGQPPVVTETGAYTGELLVKYNSIVAKFAKTGGKLVDFVNGAWPQFKPDVALFKEYPGKIIAAAMENTGIMAEINEFKKLAQAAGV